MGRPACTPTARRRRASRAREVGRGVSSCRAECRPGATGHALPHMSIAMTITRRTFGLAALGALVAPAPALAKSPFAGAQAPGVYRLKVGGFEVTVLSDGYLPIETKIFSGDAEGAAKLLERAFLPKDATVTSVNEWVINTGDKL